MSIEPVFNTLLPLIDAAISGDVIADTGGGAIHAMAARDRGVREDIPAAFEMYSLLRHFGQALPAERRELGPEQPALSIQPSLQYDQAQGLVLALVDIPADTLQYVAHWISDRLPSPAIRRMAGVLALPFTVHHVDRAPHLLPDWWVAFYINGDPGHCIPVLTMRSMQSTSLTGGDWVGTVLHRMLAYSLPQEAAARAAADVKVRRPGEPA